MQDLFVCIMTVNMSITTHCTSINHIAIGQLMMQMFNSIILHLILYWNGKGVLICKCHAGNVNLLKIPLSKNSVEK